MVDWKAAKAAITPEPGKTWNECVPGDVGTVNERLQAGASGRDPVTWFYDNYNAAKASGDPWVDGDYIELTTGPSMKYSSLLQGGVTSGRSGLYHRYPLNDGVERTLSVLDVAEGPATNPSGWSYPNWRDEGVEPFVKSAGLYDGRTAARLSSESDFGGNGLWWDPLGPGGAIGADFENTMGILYDVSSSFSPNTIGYYQYNYRPSVGLQRTYMSRAVSIDAWRINGTPIGVSAVGGNYRDIFCYMIGDRYAIWFANRTTSPLESWEFRSGLCLSSTNTDGRIVGFWGDEHASFGPCRMEFVSLAFGRMV